VQKDISRKLGQAIKWSSLAEIIAKLIAPVTNAILARILIPKAFGVVATLTMVVSFAEVFTDAGFQKYLVQHEFENDEDFDVATDVAFWTNFIVSMLIWLGIAVFATPITNLVGSPGCEEAVVVMSMQIPVLAFSSIQIARYRRAFEFKQLFIARISTALVPLIITVPLALYYRSYWALVIGTLTRDILNAVILSLKSEWKPRFVYNIFVLKEMFSFSLWTLIENITIWLCLNADVFIVSRFLDAFYMGVYKTSIATVNSLMSLITASTTPVLFSALSRCQNDENEFKDVLYSFQKRVSLIAFPLGFGVYVFRELVTSILLGSQWTEAVELLGMWALVSALGIIFHNYNSEVMRSKGRPKLSVLTQVLHIVVLIPVLIVYVQRGYQELAVARCLVHFEMVLVSSTIVYCFFKLSFLNTVKNVLPQLLSSIVMALVGIKLRTFAAGLLWELISILLCCFVYAGCMLILPNGRKQIKELPIIGNIIR